MIEGIQIHPLKRMHDERGKVMHMLRNDAKWYEKFGEIYFSTIEPGAVKAWHIHKRMTLNYTVPIGKIKLVLFDNREKSGTKGQIQELFIGPDNYNLIIIPPMVWNGFKGISKSSSIVANCSTIPHDPNEIDRIDPIDGFIPYEWGIKHG